MAAAILLAALAASLGLALTLARTRLPADSGQLIEAINALLPQTQCAQCGHAGCRPYAEAIAGGAALDLCPPGGPETHRALQRLLASDTGQPPSAPAAVVAEVREEDCVGCFLCVEACPVDAIVGAPGYLHTVLADQCTGCELCLPACPMDCIELLPAAGSSGPSLTAASDQTRPCIGCNRCEPVCPADLAPQYLLRLVRAGQVESASTAGLSRCIECHLCDRACPSDIPLAAGFSAAKRQLATDAAKLHRAETARAHFEARQARLDAAEQKAQARRQRRLSRISHQEPEPNMWPDQVAD